jgi:GDP-4-dehydro-6-deoxy-D-mannose reductase
MRVLITGIEGFAGGHLSTLLVKEGFDVFGIKYPESPFENIEHLKDKISVKAVDINNHGEVRSNLEDIKPDGIIHLAAFSRVGLSWRSKVETYRTNILATSNILEVAAEINPPPAVLMISSAEVYGPLPQEKMPIKEEFELNPTNPYAVSKAAVEMITLQFLHEIPELAWKIVRPFNHTGPNQTTGFVCSDFARQIALIESGRIKPEIKVGNLNAKRDFSDVRDIVRAYKMLIESDTKEIYNVCSGRTYSIKEILEMLLDMSKSEIKVTVDVSKFRPVDTPVIVGDNSKIKKDLGWEPEYNFEDTLLDLLNYWRKKTSLLEGDMNG